MARSGLAQLIEIVRGYTDGGSADYSIGTVTYWSDDHLQVILDRHAQDVYHEQLVSVEKWVSGGSVQYFEYQRAYSNFEQTTGGTAIFIIEDGTGADIAGTLYTADYLRGRITFLSDTSGSTYYLTGRNAWYFQQLAQGVPADKAKNKARKLGQEIFPAGNMKESLVISAKVWKTWILVAIYFTTFGGFIAMTAWLPTYWKSFFAASAVTAGTLTATYSILTSVIRVVGGGVSDRLGGENTAMLSLLTMLVGAALMTVSRDFSLSVAAEILMALFLIAAGFAVAIVWWKLIK